MILRTGDYQALDFVAVVATGRVGLSCVFTLGPWSTHKDDLCGHSWHLVNARRKLMILKTGAYPTLELYGNVSTGAGGTGLLVHSRHLVTI